MQKVLFFPREGINSVWQMLIFTIKVLAPLRKRLEITLFRSERSHWSIAREIHLRKYFPPTDESFNWCVIRTKAKSDFLIAPFSGIILDIAHNHPELFSFFSRTSCCMECIVIYGRDRIETKLRHQSAGERVNNRPLEPAIQTLSGQRRVLKAKLYRRQFRKF